MKMKYGGRKWKRNEISNENNESNEISMNNISKWEDSKAKSKKKKRKKCRKYQWKRKWNNEENNSENEISKKIWKWRIICLSSEMKIWKKCEIVSNIEIYEANRNNEKRNENENIEISKWKWQYINESLLICEIWNNGNGVA